MNNSTTTTVFRLLFLVLGLVTISSAQSASTRPALRGLAPLIDERRQHLFEGLTCTLFRKCIQHVADEDHPEGAYHEDPWACQLSKEDSLLVGGIEFVEIDETTNPNLAALLASARTHESILTVSEAILDSETINLRIPENAVAEVTDSADTQENNNNIRRQLTRTHGVLKTLVIRVHDKHNRGPTADTNQLIEDVFTDESSLKTQMEACSHDKLKVEPFTGLTPSDIFINNGVVDVTMDNWDMAERNTTDNSGIDNAAMTAAKELLGDLNDPMFDVVMFCFPPAVAKFMAFAYGASKYSFYHNGACSYVTSQMHEVGHSLGLGHSGQVHEDVYGDSTGYMGISLQEDDHKQCYNPPKSYQLGWYEDQTASIDPTGATSPLEYTLNGVDDYGKNPEALIVLRLEQADLDEDYYLGYNRATGRNANTNEDHNLITITRQGATGQSTKIKSLAPGEQTCISEFNGGDKADCVNGGDKAVWVAFTGLTESGDAHITISKSKLSLSTENCETFTVEVTTGQDPGDYSWYFADTGGWGRVGARSNKYWGSNQEYSNTICLPRRSESSTTYRFSFENKAGRSMGDNGGYRVLDKAGLELFSGGSDFSSEKTWNHHELVVAAGEAEVVEVVEVVDDVTNNNDVDTSDNSDNNSDTEESASKKKKKKKKKKRKRCKDKRGKFNIGKGKAKKCKQYAKNNCDTIIKGGSFDGKAVKDVCKKSCKVC